MEDIEIYKQALQSDLSELQGELKAIGIHDPENTKNWIAVPEVEDTFDADLNEASDRAEEWGSRQSTVAVLERRYNNIVRALAKIKEGTYGICEIGKEHIEADRLSANPAARTCKAHMDQESSLSIY